MAMRDVAHKSQHCTEVVEDRCLTPSELSKLELARSLSLSLSLSLSVQVLRDPSLQSLYVRAST